MATPDSPNALRTAWREGADVGTGVIATLGGDGPPSIERLTVTGGDEFGNCHGVLVIV